MYQRRLFHRQEKEEIVLLYPVSLVPSRGPGIDWVL